jgi:phosphoribosyl 1,2-cyclic phosphate phosphodiesterase
VCKSTDARDKRLRVSIWVKWENGSFVVDCGPDFRQQMLTSGCKDIDAILFTHEHSDHTAGLDDIRPFYFMKAKPIKLYGQQRVLKSLAKRFDYIFENENKYPGAPSIDAIEVKENTNFKINDLTIVPIKANHGNINVFGYRFSDFVYLTDVKSIASDEVSKLINVKILVINALRNEEHHSHFSLQDALDFIHLVQPEKAYLTHISHLLGFHDEVEKKLPKNVFLAYDNLKIKID